MGNRTELSRCLSISLFTGYLVSLYIVEFAVEGRKVPESSGDSSESTVILEEIDESLPDFPSAVELNEEMAKRVKEWGFQLDVIEVLTEDGYILRIHRLYKNKSDLKSPVLIMHGVTGCSANYLVFRPSIAFFLAERGYDVWVGNARGTAFSLKHRNMQSGMSYKNKRFWKFSFHEMGHLDLPAFLMAIARERPDHRVHYVGHSMGTTMFLVFASTRHEYLPQIASISLVAPVARPQHFDMIKNPTIRSFFMIFFKVVDFIGKRNLWKYRKSISSAIYSMCKSKNITGQLCEQLLRALSKGTDIFDFRNALDTYMFYPCGTSTRTYQHFVQLARAGTFQEYDHGKEKNIKKYQSETPPEYDLASFDNAVYLLVGGEDTKADKRDVEWLHDKLVNAKYISANFELFDHRDFEFGTEIAKSHNTVLNIIEGFDQGKDPKVNVDVLVKTIDLGN